MKTPGGAFAPAPTIRPTKRGIGTLLVLVLASWLALEHGLRSLHAIMIPLAVVLVAAAVTTYRVDEPEVRRTPVEEGFIGERRTVEVTIDADRPVAATVRDAVGDGLAPVDESNVAETMLRPAGRFTYEVALERRGEHGLGPLTIVVTDLLGLVQRRLETDRTTAAVVYPRVYDLRTGNERDLRLLADVADVADREEFDHLREYTRGDSMRNVHWKSAAKRPDEELMIKEFENEIDRGAAMVAAECTPGREDEMATAAASAVTYLLQLGVSVGLTLPDGSRRPSAGRAHHRELLGRLAVVSSGELDAPDRERADVLVQADASGTVVVVGDAELPFDRLRGARIDGERGREDPRRRNRDRRTDPDERASSGGRPHAPGENRGVNA